MVHSVEWVSKIKSIRSIIFHEIIFHAIYQGCVHSAYLFLLWWLWEYMYFILLSSLNWKYDLFAIVYH